MPPQPLYPLISPRALPELEGGLSPTPRSPSSPHLLTLAQRRRSRLTEVLSPSESTSGGSLSTPSQNIAHPSFPTYGSPTEETFSTSSLVDGADIENDSSPSQHTVFSSPPPGIANKRWKPFHLKTTLILANIIFCLVVAIALEILLKVNRNAYGWEPPAFYSKFPQIHVLWTFLPG